jgi:2'-hydroxyisoflavone reductase
MRILVVGGTRFVGKHVVEQALARGHEVTLFHRGHTGMDLFADLEHRFGDRNTDLSALAEGEWDATVDTCAYVPRQVHDLADALRGRGGHHLLVSSVSVYATPDGPGIDEDAELIELDDPTTEEVTGETYGGLKVLCERAAVERHGTSTLLVRPTYVVGPDDHTWRFPWWVARIAQGGEVVAPGPPDAPAQVIDVRDLGEWMVRLLEDGRSGAFHAASPAPVFTWREQVEAIAAAVAPDGTTVHWVEPAAVEAAGIEPGAFPLWSGDDPDVWVMAADPARAFATGLTPRPLADTIRDTLAWTRTVTLPEGTGVTPEQERRLLG